MILKTLSRLISSQLLRGEQTRKCHSVFDFKQLIQPEKAENFRIKTVTSSHHEMAIEVIKEHYLSEHVFVQERQMDLDDRALDEYLKNLLKQGNALYALADDGEVAGVCVNFASSVVDPQNLRQYAVYRQDPNVKDFLGFTAKLQETPNLWEAFNQKKIFEIKMLTVVPEYRRQGLATALVERSKEQALDQGYKVVRMDCINPYDYKIAERCMLQCVVKFPLHKLRGPHAPYIRRSSARNRRARVYLYVHPGVDRAAIKERSQELESLIDYKIAERCMLQCVVKFPLHKPRGPHAPYIRRSSARNRRARVYLYVHPGVDRAAIKERSQELESLIE